MAQSDRAIPEKDRCPTCSGAGWTLFEAEPESKWIVCRDCISGVPPLPLPKIKSSVGRSASPASRAPWA